MIVPYTTLPQPSLDVLQQATRTRPGEPSSRHALPMPLSKRYLYHRAPSRPLLLLPPHALGHAQNQPPDASLFTSVADPRYDVHVAVSQTAAAAPIIIGTIVGPLPTTANTNTLAGPVQSPTLTSAPSVNTVPLSSANTIAGTTPTSETASTPQSTASPSVPVPPTLGHPSDPDGNSADRSTSDDNGRSLLRLLEIVLIPVIAVAVAGLIIFAIWKLWGPGGRYRKRRGGQGNAGAAGGGGWLWWKGEKRQKRRGGGRKGSRDLDGAVLAFVGGSGRLRRDGSLIYGPAYEVGTGLGHGEEGRKRGSHGTGTSANSHEMYGQRYPQLDAPGRYGDEDEDESKELGYLGTTPTKASTQPYDQPPGRFKWPDLSINSLRRSIRRPGGSAVHQYPPHDFRRHIVDLSKNQQQDDIDYVNRYQTPYDNPHDQGSGRVAGPPGGPGPREGFRHWGVSLQETYHNEVATFPYTDYPENEWEWMKENGTLPARVTGPDGTKYLSSVTPAVVSRNQSEASMSVYPPSRAMSKRSAGTVKGLGLEDGAKGRRLLEEVKKEKTWMDSIRGLLGGGAPADSLDGAPDREALVKGGNDGHGHEEEEMTPRALSRSGATRSRPSFNARDSSPFVNEHRSGSALGYHEEDGYDDVYRTSKAGSHQHQRLTAPSKRRAHKRGDSDAYVDQREEPVELEAQTTPTQAVFRGARADELEMASFGAAMHGLDGNAQFPETPNRRPRLSNARHSYAPLRDKEEEELKRDRYTPKPARTREIRSRSRDTSVSPSRYTRSRSGTVSSESVPMTIRHVDSNGESNGQGFSPQKSPTSMAKDILPRSPPQITSPPLDSQMFFATPPKLVDGDVQTPGKHSSRSRKTRSNHSNSTSRNAISSPPSTGKTSLSSRSGTPARRTPTASRSSTASSKPIPPPLLPPAGSASTAHNRSDITFTSRLTAESTGTAARVHVAQSQALDKLGRIVESSWNVREQEIGQEGMRALSPTLFGRKVQG